MSLLTTRSALSIGLSREAGAAAGRDSEEWGVLLLTSALLFFFSLLRFSLLALAVSELSSTGRLLLLLLLELVVDSWIDTRMVGPRS